MPDDVHGDSLPVSEAIIVKSVGIAGEHHHAVQFAEELEQLGVILPAQVVPVHPPGEFVSVAERPVLRQVGGST